MSVATLRLVFAGVWLLIAVGLLTRHWTAPPALAGRLESRNLDLGGLLAVGFAVWNLARWRQARKWRAVERRRPRPPGGEWNPEFDFGGSSDRSPTR